MGMPHGHTGGINTEWQPFPDSLLSDIPASYLIFFMFLILCGLTAAVEGSQLPWSKPHSRLAHDDQLFTCCRTLCVA